MQNALLKIEQILDCEICTFSLNQTRIIGQCGHQFCLECITEALKKESKCPTCHIPAELKDLQADPIYDNLLIYLDKMKTSLLSHTLTPLDDSLYPSLIQRQQQHPQTQSINSRMLKATDDEILPHIDSNTKRSHALSEINEEDELEDEYYDSSPASKKLRTATDSQKKRLFDPKNMLEDMLPPSMSLSSQLSTVPRKNTQNSLQHQQSTENVAIPTDVASTVESTLTDATSEAIKDTTPPNSEDVMDIDSIPSDTDDDIQQKERWQCSECQFTNAAYLQTCGVCRTYRKKDIPIMSTGPSSTIEVAASIAENQKKKADYKLTVAGENNTMDLPTSLSTRRRTEKSQDEAHILYTGLTPVDEKKLEKIKDEAVQSRLKIFIHYKMRDFDEITHIITSVNKKKLCRRTLKYLQGVLEGKWIVDPTWLIDSMKSKKWLPEDKYEVQGDQASGDTHAPSRGRKQKNQPLFDGMTFYFYGDFTGKHSKNDLLILSRAGGAKISNRKPAGRGSRVDKTDELDRSEPVVIYSSTKHPSWLYECQVRDPAWIIDCIGHLKVE